MQIDLNNLPSDTTLLHRLVREMAVVVDSRDGEIERLQPFLDRFGARGPTLPEHDQLHGVTLLGVAQQRAAAAKDFITGVRANGATAAGSVIFASDQRTRA